MCSLLGLSVWYLLVSTGLGGLSAAVLYGLVDEQSVAEVASGERVCVVKDWGIAESSGLAISRRHSDCFWTHNDSGDGPRLFLVDASGMTRGILTVATADPVDWEDVCSFELDGQSWLLVADVGDNAGDRGRDRRGCRLLLLAEPELRQEAAGRVQSWVGEVRSEIEVSYPGGPRDCESVAVDVTSRTVFLVSKRPAGQAGLYSLELNVQQRLQRVELREEGSLAVPYATGMDISADGLRLVLVNPVSGVLFGRRAGEVWGQAIRRAPQILTVPLRKQGESVCFESGGKSVLAGSEGRWQAVWRVRLPEQASE
ncbi:MAG: hypothetical protein ACOVRM_13385 [Planctomycetaceae bacterium]|jgi:hypothetical protein